MDADRLGNRELEQESEHVVHTLFAPGLQPPARAAPQALMDLGFWSQPEADDGGNEGRILSAAS